MLLYLTFSGLLELQDSQSVFFRPGMTERLLTWTLSLYTNKHTNRNLFESREALHPQVGGVGDVAIAILSHEHTQ